MFKIMTVDGSEIGIVDKVTYIKLADNGCLIEAPEREADGVAIQGNPYNLIGKTKLEDKEQVIVREISALDVMLEKFGPDIDAIYAIMSDVLLAEDASAATEDIPVEEVAAEETTTSDTSTSEDTGSTVEETTDTVEEPASEA